MMRLTELTGITRWKKTICSGWQSVRLKPYLRKLDSWNRVQFEKILMCNGWTELVTDKEYLSVIVKVASTKRAVAMIGKLKHKANIRNIIGNTITAEIQVACLPEILRHKEILHLKICERRHRALLGPSSQQFHNQPLVAIIDTDIHLQYNQLLDRNGKFRVIALWNQRKLGMNGPFLSGPTPGKIYYGDEIKSYFENKKSKYQIGHGEAAVMIAAGNKPIRLAENFLVNLPTAEFPIILVETTKDEGDLLDALGFLQQQSQLLGLPCVVNLPFAKHNGPHDGSSFLSTALESMADSRFIVVAAGGNDGTKSIHHREILEQQQRSVEFEIKKSARNNNNLSAGIIIYGWYDQPKQLRLSLADPYGNVYGPVKSNSWREWASSFAKMTVTNNISTNSKNEIQLVIQFQQDCVEGVWRLVCEGEKQLPVTVDFWVVSKTGCECGFIGGQHSNPFTVSDFAVSKEVLAVGGYGLDSLTGRYRVVPESSYSRVEKGVKPDLLAPWSFEVHNKENQLARVEGSSYAVPLITRLVAQIWKNNPHLDAAEIKRFLKGKMLIFENTDLGFFQKEAALESFKSISWDEASVYFDKCEEWTPTDETNMKT